MAGHGGVAVFEDDVEYVLAFFDRVGDGCDASPEERRVAHQRVLLVRDKGVHSTTGGTSKTHCGEVVHFTEGWEEGHGVAADVAVGENVLVSGLLS